MRKIGVLTVIFLLLLSLVPAIHGGALAQEPTSLTGTIDNENPYAQVYIDVTAGDHIAMAAVATSGDLDTYLVLFDPNGDWAAENDDADSTTTDSYLEYDATATGQYLIVVGRYGFADGASSGDVTLSYLVGPAPTSAAQTTQQDNFNAAPTQTPAGVAEWTILAYIGGDNNLEQSALIDTNEFEIAGGSDANVRVVVFLDRSPQYDTSNEDWSTARVYEMGPDSGAADSTDASDPLIDTTALYDLGSVNSGSGSTFKDFLLWGIANFPAQNYVVEINDHGGGWTGLVSDESMDDMTITLPEYVDAFQAATAAAGVDRFALLINDACLMSSVEYLSMIAPYFDYSLGAAEIMYGPGYDLSLLTNGLRQNMPFDQLGQQLIDNYMETMSGFGIDASQAPTLIDLKQFPAVTDAVENFAQVYNSNPYQYANDLGDARANTYNYATGNWLDFLVDAGDLMTKVQYASKDPALTTAAQSVLDAMQAALVYHRHGADVPDTATQMNINFPLSADTYISAYPSQTTLTGWNELLGNYYSIFGGGNSSAGSFQSSRAGSEPRAAKLAAPPALAQPTLPPSVAVVPSSTTPQVTITSVYPQDVPLSVNTQAIVSMEVIGRNISSGTFTVDQVQPDGTIRRVDTSDIVTFVEIQDGVFDYINQWDSGVNDFDFTWTPTLYTLSDGTNTNVELIVSQDKQNYLVGRYRDSAAADWTEARLTFNDQGVATRAVATGEKGQGLAGAIPLRTGGEFQAYNAIVTPDGRLVNRPGNTYTIPEGGLTMGSTNAPTGAYNLGFLIEAHGGVTGFSSASVTVDNDHVDPTLVGFTTLTEGFTVQSPADWTTMEWYSERGYYSNNDVTGVANYYVYPVTTATDLESTMQGVLDGYSMTLAGEPTPITVSGLDALEFSFTGANEDGSTYQGKAFAVYKSDIGEGLVFSAELTDGSDPSDLYAQLLKNTMLFDPTSVNTARKGTWDYDVYTEETYYPVPLAWLPGATSDFGWTYQVPDVAGAFAAVSVLTTGDDARAVLEDLMTTYAPANAAVSKVETYYGENHTWEIAYYTAGDTTGRMAVTVENGTPYALWFEAPTAQAETLFRDDFEPILDGFKITPTQVA